MNKIKARIPIAVSIIAYVAIPLIMMFTEDYVLWEDVVSQIVWSIPIILLGVYFIALYKKQSVTPYLVFALLSYSWGNGVTGFVDSVFHIFSGHKFEKLDNLYLIWSVMTILMSVSVFFIVKGSKKGRYLLITASVIGIVYDALNVLWMSEHIRYDVLDYVSYLVSILFFTALIIYAAFNDTSAHTSDSAQPTYVSIVDMSPDQALTMLKDKFDLGIITEEEYKVKRAEIISKL